jgi:predicted dehydrogenase
MSTPELPTLRWGIIATGLISSWFVSDLVLSRTDAKAKHIVQAIGSSSLEKGKKFAEKYCPTASPKVYGSYEEVYRDPEVDAVYIGTPHAFHAANCLDAIAGGKHVLCEKAFTINAAEAKKVFDAAREKNVFVMEAMWTRFFPATHALREMLHQQKVIGQVHRMFCDFGLDMQIPLRGPDSRLKNPKLGAGSILDIGVYSLTWGLLVADAEIAEKAQKPVVVASQVLSEGIDMATTAVLTYPSGAHAITTSTMSFKTPREFCRIEGTEGYIVVEGKNTAVPEAFTVYLNKEEAGSVGKKYSFDKVGDGFYWEADAVAVDIAAERKENEIMPWAETMRVMEMMDEIRRQGGLRYPQDDEAAA